MGAPKLLILVSLAVVLYSTVITVRLLSLDKSKRELCLSPPPPTSEVQESVQQTVQESVQETVQDAQVTVPPWEQHLDFDGFDNDTGTPDGHYIVPNYVHFIKFGEAKFSFVDALCVLAAFKHQRPERLYIHTNVDGFHGKYWDVVANTEGLQDVLLLRKIPLPTSIFNQTLNKDWKFFHGSYVARIQILKEFGGIYLDSDSYQVRSLDDFRRYEMSVGWVPGRDFGNQVLVAHKDARFLQLWLESYRLQYKSQCWYCNTVVIPTQNILRPHPHLVHRVDRLFGYYGVKEKIFLQKFPKWKDYYALHLHSRRLSGGMRDLVMNEFQAVKTQVAFGDMCKAVYPYPKTKRGK